MCGQENPEAARAMEAQGLEPEEGWDSPLWDDFLLRDDDEETTE